MLVSGVQVGCGGGCRTAPLVSQRMAAPRFEEVVADRAPVRTAYRRVFGASGKIGEVRVDVWDVNGVHAVRVLADDMIDDELVVAPGTWRLDLAEDRAALRLWQRAHGPLDAAAQLRTLLASTSAGAPAMYVVQRSDGRRDHALHVLAPFSMTWEEAAEIASAELAAGLDEHVFRNLPPARKARVALRALRDVFVQHERLRRERHEHERCARESARLSKRRGRDPRHAEVGPHVPYYLTARPASTRGGRAAQLPQIVVGRALLQLGVDRAAIATMLGEAKGELDVLRSAKSAWDGKPLSSDQLRRELGWVGEFDAAARKRAVFEFLETTAAGATPSQRRRAAD